MDMDRRSFLTAAAGMSGMSAAPPIPIIDTHIHLFDPRRPHGIPWPPKDNAILYKPALPGRYRKIAAPLGVVGAIEVEASPWLEDNQWVLDTIAKTPLLVGTIGNLEPGEPQFKTNLERFHRDPLFLGIRYGNLWGRSLSQTAGRQEFLSDLRLLAESGLTLDTANPNPELLDAVLKVNDRVPGLRIVLDHLPQMQDRADLGEFATRPNIFVKLSEVFRHIAGRVPRDLSVYRAKLDEIFGVFGEDRVLYGSDWPNSDTWRPYADVLRLVQEYFAGKSRAAAEKYFWKNSVRAYRWVRRDPSQPATNN